VIGEAGDLIHTSHDTTIGELHGKRTLPAVGSRAFQVTHNRNGPSGGSVKDQEKREQKCMCRMSHDVPPEPWLLYAIIRRRRGLV
jgi:hypothetical protein